MEMLNNVPVFWILSGLLALFVVFIIASVIRGSSWSEDHPLENMSAAEQKIHAEKTRHRDLGLKVYDIINSWNGEWHGHEAIVEAMSERYGEIITIEYSRQRCKKLRSLGYLDIKHIRGEGGKMIGSGYTVV